MFEPEEQTKAAENLVALIEKSDRHLRTGFLGTALLAPVLQKFDYSEIMYDILFKETYPSWFYSINHGATTTWERWDSYSLKEGFNSEKMNSLNHYAYGAVASWFYRGMLGIEQSTTGFKAFTVSPQFNEKLEKVSGSQPTPQGDISVSWVIENKALSMTLVVPKNSEATLNLPSVVNVIIQKEGQPVVNTKVSTTANSVPLSPGNYTISGVIK